MTVQEFLNDIPVDEKTRRLRLLDQGIMNLHDRGLYVVCNIQEIEIIDGTITMESFKNKVDYLNSGFNVNGDKQDIIELCAIGICSYNGFSKLYSNLPFIKMLMDNFDEYVNNGKVPPAMVLYYEEVFLRGNVIYLNIYLLSTDVDVNAKQIEDSGRDRGRVKVYATAAGKALAADDTKAAFVQVLVLPAILVLVYAIIMACYFVFFK